MNKTKVSALVSCYNGSKYLPVFLDNYAQQTIVGQTEIVLVHNQPSVEEVDVVKNFQSRHPGLINHIVVPRELWDVSMNRAIRAARGEYVCVWNVDDLRTPDSLELMAKTLDSNPVAGFTYGDFMIVTKWESQHGRIITTPEFNKLQFIQSMILGPFFMWRKSLCQTLGLWDEQFRTGGDFDFAARLAVESTGKKTSGLLGYYLDAGLGLSTGKTPWQAIERTAIELRFGIYHKLDFWYYARATKYRLDEILVDGQWTKLQPLMPDSGNYKESKMWLFYAALRYPFWILKRAFKKIIRSLQI